MKGVVRFDLLDCNGYYSERYPKMKDVIKRLENVVEDITGEDIRYFY